VANVFQLVPQPPKKNSGSPQFQHNQRSEVFGRQAHFGQRMRSKSLDCARRLASFFSTRSGGGVF